MRSKSLKLALAAGLAGAAGFTAGAVMLVTPAGCTDCNVPVCPSVVASVQAEKNVDLPITYIERDGPSCPSDRPLCRGDDQTTTCTHTEFYGTGPGYCWVYIEFADRPAEAVRFDFGEKTSCCPGTPIIGASTYYIPVSPNATIYGPDGGANDGAIIIVPDGGTDGGDDAGTD
jgi:hypothetical protein